MLGPTTLAVAQPRRTLLVESGRGTDGSGDDLSCGVDCRDRGGLDDSVWDEVVQLQMMIGSIASTISGGEC